jgi:hypothetical protein
VLAPGGQIIIADSLQNKDVSDYEQNLEISGLVRDLSIARKKQTKFFSRRKFLKKKIFQLTCCMLLNWKRNAETKQ